MQAVETRWGSSTLFVALAREAATNASSVPGLAETCTRVTCMSSSEVEARGANARPRAGRARSTRRSGKFAPMRGATAEAARRVSIASEGVRIPQPIEATERQHRETPPAVGAVPRDRDAIRRCAKWDTAGARQMFHPGWSRVTTAGNPHPDPGPTLQTSSGRYPRRRDRGLDRRANVRTIPRRRPLPSREPASPVPSPEAFGEDDVASTSDGRTRRTSSPPLAL